MSTLYILEQNARLHLERRRLRVIREEQELQTIPLIKVEQVVIFGNIGLTTPALRALLSRNIDVIFLDRHGRYRGRLIGETSPHVELRLWQYRRADDAGFALKLAQTIVAAKIQNTTVFLNRYRRRLNAEILELPILRLQELRRRVAGAPTLHSLVGIEGAASAAYFGHFRHLITTGSFVFEKRIRRPPTDPVNALLSFGYTLLARQMESITRSVGLDPYLGFLHGIAYNRPSLALDLIEEFRTIIIDSVALRCLNAGLLTPAHFQKEPPAQAEPDPDDLQPADDPPALRQGQLAGYPIWLTEAGKAIFLHELETRLQEKFNHPITGENADYRRCFELQAREIARCIKAGDAYRPFIVR